MHSYSVPNDHDDNYARIIVHHYINPDCKINDTGIFYIKDTLHFQTHWSVLCQSTRRIVVVL